MSEIKKCAYCGDDADSIDHFIPLSYYHSGKRKGLHLTAEYGKENLVDCCLECNNLASNNVFQFFEDKKNYVQGRLTVKYRKVINTPFWSKKQIDEMGMTFRKEIKIQQLARAWILNRVNYPTEVYPAIKLNRKIKNFFNKEL